MLDIVAATAVPISDHAIVVDPRDNVAVVKAETFPGLTLEMPSGDTVAVSATIPPGHRFATRGIPAGEFVRQYGQPIGTSLGIEKGEWVSHENMNDEVPVIRSCLRICTRQNQSILRTPK